MGAPILILVSGISLFFLPRYESVQSADFDDRFGAVINRETSFQIVSRGPIESRQLPLRLRLRFPKSDIGPMVGFPDSASEIQLTNHLGERIAVRIEFRRGNVCFVEVSGGAPPSIEQLMVALRGEFAGLAIVKGSTKTGPNKTAMASPIPPRVD